MIARWLVLPLAVLVAAAEPAPLERDVDSTLHRIYDPYSRASYRDVDWDRPVFSRGTRRLIRQWQVHIGKALTIYNDFAWFCACQDWDAKAFRFERRSIVERAEGRAEVMVHVVTGFDGFSDQSLTLVREHGRWVIDDMTSESMPAGLIAGLREELAAPVEAE